MTGAQLQTLPASLSGEEQALIDALRRAFGVDFSIVDSSPASPTSIETNTEVDASGDADHQSLYRLVEAARAGAESHSEILNVSHSGDVTLGTLSGRRRVVCVTSRLRRSTMTAVGVVSGMEAADVLRVATFAAESAATNSNVSRNADQIEAYAEQVTSCFEELVWLRELSLQIKQCNVTRDIRAVAQVVLPSLARLTNSETVALLTVDHPSEPPLSERPISVAVCAGPETPMSTVLTAIVERFGTESCKTPVVINCFSGDDEAFLQLGIRSLVLMPIQQQEHLYGWLLAVNRLVDAAAGSRLRLIEELGLDEFGTEEAGLMQSACTLLATHAHNVELFAEKEKLAIETVRSLVQSLEARDSYTRGHSDRVAAMAVVLAKAVGYTSEALRKLHLTGVLHDIGKIGVSDVVLNKPGRLTNEEFDQIKQHPTIGFQILKPVKSLSYVLDGVLHHHENFDGTGYPHGLAGEEIPLDARILAVADAFDAMTSDRPYRAGLPVEKTQAILKDGSGTQWDAKIIQAFFDNFDKVRKSARIDASSRTPDETVVSAGACS